MTGRVNNALVTISFVAVAFLAGVTVWPFVDYILEPVPYDRVRIVSMWRAGNELFIEAAFRKRDCVQVRFHVTGYQNGYPHALIFRDVDGHEDGHDRTRGDELLRHAWLIGYGEDYDEIVARTRHNCGTEDEPKYVDREFVRIRDIPHREYVTPQN